MAVRIELTIEEIEEVKDALALRIADLNIYNMSSLFSNNQRLIEKRKKEIEVLTNVVKQLEGYLGCA